MIGAIVAILETWAGTPEAQRESSEVIAREIVRRVIAEQSSPAPDVGGWDAHRDRLERWKSGKP
jgi:hypothetical protein